MDKARIERFLGVGNRNGLGYSSGFGLNVYYGLGLGRGLGLGNGADDGCGDCWSDGAGSSLEHGFGYGRGYGWGSSWGNGSSAIGCIAWCYKISQYCGQDVYMIDDVPTLIDHIHGNIAKGRILHKDFSTEKCYVVRQGDLFAHGATLREARDAVVSKLFDDMSEEERITAFMEAHEWGKEYPNQDLYEWHHRLTGSCEMGRRTFAEEHNIDLNASMTVQQFIQLTRDAYRSDIIRKLERRYNEQKRETDKIKRACF